MILHRNRLIRSAIPGDFQRIWTARNSDNAHSCFRAQLRQKRAKEPDADDRDALAWLNIAPPEDIDRTAKRLSGERLAFERLGQSNGCARRRGVKFGISVVGKQCHTIARFQSLDALPRRLDAPPPLMPRLAGSKRIRKPGSSFPRREV